MQAPEIKKLVETYPLDQLIAAEEAILEGNTPEISIGGKDEGEQLTHTTAAIWIHQEMKKGIDFRIALRAFMEKVRNSIN